MSDNLELVQAPLFDLSYLDLFDLKINNKNVSDWDRFLDEFLLLRFLYFRNSFQEGNIEFISYFTNLLEGSFLILKSDIINECMFNIKTILTSNEADSIKLKKIIPDYLQIVNLGRIIIVHLIKTLYSKEIKINNNTIQKYMVSDSELDNTEKKGIKQRIMNFNYIKSHMPQGNQRIEYKTVIEDFMKKVKDEDSGCKIF